VQSGQLVGSFRVADKLGAGGMGDVWRARRRQGRRAMKGTLLDGYERASRHAAGARRRAALAMTARPAPYFWR
jgi:hypothetical protein